MDADQRPGRRLRPAARRVDDLDARDRLQRLGCSHPDEPLDRRRPHLGPARHDIDLERQLLRQELDHLRHVAAEPSLRQLLPGVGRFDALHEHVDGRRTDLGREEDAEHERHRRPAGRAAERHGRRPVRGRCGHPRISVDERGRYVAVLGSGGDNQLSRCGGEPAHLRAALGRGRRRRQGLRRLAGLQLPLGLHLERHRLQHLARRRRVDCEDAGPDRPDEQRRRPLHPGLRGRPLDLGEQHPPRARATTTTRSRTARRRRAS